MDRSLALRVYAILLLAATSAGCELAQGIFKAGMWVGVLMVVAVIGLVLFLVTRLKS